MIKEIYNCQVIIRGLWGRISADGNITTFSAICASDNIFRLHILTRGIIILKNKIHIYLLI